MKGNLALMLIVYMTGIVVLIGAGYYYMKGASPEIPDFQNMTGQPTFSAVSPTDVFGISTGTPTPDAGTPTPNVFCEDGTALGECNEDLRQCRETGNGVALEVDCEACGCWEGERCHPITRGCYKGCADGTLLEDCSLSTDKYYCNPDGELVLNGSECGCPRGYQYDPYGSGPDTVNDCTRTCRFGIDCEEGR
ncbi:hypothetical protein KJ765_01715 [Candidatus Micrarchaeota archaeon]|nr:hypothetical protein [Candidatus Micrarchaeota archaeon]